MDKILQCCGIVFLATILILLVAGLADFIAEAIDQLRWKYKYKHRFDKKPTAKCYCKDCKCFYKDVNGGGHCLYSHHNEECLVAESWFCWNAEPRNKE